MIFQVLKLQFMVRCQLRYFFLIYNIIYLLSWASCCMFLTALRLRSSCNAPKNRSGISIQDIQTPTLDPLLPVPPTFILFLFSQIGQQLVSEELNKMCIIFKLHLRMFNITMKFQQQTAETAFWEGFTCRKNCFEVKLLKMCELFGLAWDQYPNLPTFLFPSGKFITYMKISTCGPAVDILEKKNKQ